MSKTFKRIIGSPPSIHKKQTFQGKKPKFSAFSYQNTIFTPQF
jgi:hypothetical protein